MGPFRKTEMKMDKVIGVALDSLGPVSAVTRLACTILLQLQSLLPLSPLESNALDWQTEGLDLSNSLPPLSRLPELFSCLLTRRAKVGNY